MLTTVKVTILGTEGMLHIRMLHLMSILVYLTTLWTSIAFNVTWYPVLCSPSQLLFPLHHYLHIVCPRTHAHIHTHTRPNSKQHIIRPYSEPAESRALLHALFFAHAKERYYSLDVIWVLADAKETKCVPSRIFQGFVARCKNISIFMFFSE